MAKKEPTDQELLQLADWAYTSACATVVCLFTHTLGC